jgi:hypothetical protein
VLGSVLLTEMRAAELHDFEGYESLGDIHAAFLQPLSDVTGTLAYLAQAQIAVSAS